MPADRSPGRPRVPEPPRPPGPAAPLRTGPIAVLINPAAGRRRAGQLRSAILAELATAGRPVQVLPATTRAEALANAHRAVAAGAAALVAVGGDGTVHLAIQAAAGRDVALGIIPTGTGNDFAEELAIPADPVAAAAAIAAAVAAARTRRVDLARVTAGEGRERWYGAVLAAGFDAAVNARANRLRFPWGASRYQTAIALELARLRARSYTLRLDGVPWRVEAVVVAVANAARYGGGMRVCPDADLTDGWLDVAVGQAMGRLTLARLAPRIRTGRHVEHPVVTVHRAREVQLDVDPTPRPVTAFADGEEIFDLPITVRCVPAALAVLA